MFEDGRVEVGGSAAVRGLPPACGPDEDGEAVLASLESVVTQLADVGARARGAAAWSPAVRARVLRVLDHVPGVVATLRSPVLVAQRDAAAAVGGERAFLDTRARLTGASRFQAAREVGTAQALAELGQVREAVGHNVMPVSHADVLARTLHGASETVAAVLRDDATQAQVVELARGTEVREFSRSLAALVAAHDQDHLEDTRSAARRARFLHVTHYPEGTFLKGRLDPVSGEILARALDATGHREDDERTREQARADALTTLAQHTLRVGGRVSDEVTGTTSVGEAGAGREAGGEAGGGTTSERVARRRGCDDDAPAARDGAGESPAVARDGETVRGTASAPVAQVTLLVPAATWAEVRRQQERRGGRTGGGARADRCDAPGLAHQQTLEERTGVMMPPAATEDGTTTVPPATAEEGATTVPPATTEDGTVLSRSELAAALCDCAMTRVVMDERGLPLDVGRTRRMFTPAQRTAVVARDRMCAWNGCAVVPRFCEVHHIRWWHRDGGRSDLANAVLLCSHHHHHVHEQHLTIARTAHPPGEPSASGAEPAAGAPPTARYVFRDRTGAAVNAPASAQRREESGRRERRGAADAARWSPIR